MYTSSLYFHSINLSIETKSSFLLQDLYHLTLWGVNSVSSCCVSYTYTNAFRNPERRQQWKNLTLRVINERNQTKKYISFFDYTTNTKNLNRKMYRISHPQIHTTEFSNRMKHLANRYTPTILNTKAYTMFKSHSCNLLQLRASFAMCGVLFSYSNETTCLSIHT